MDSIPEDKQSNASDIDIESLNLSDEEIIETSVANEVERCPTPPLPPIEGINEDKIPVFYRRYYNITVNSPVEAKIYIDSNIGRNTTFTIESKSLEKLSVFVTSPEGQSYALNSPQYTEDLVINRTEVKVANAVSGEWLVRILTIHSHVNHTSAFWATLTVVSHAITPEAIGLRAAIDQKNPHSFPVIFAQLTKNGMPFKLNTFPVANFYMRSLERDPTPLKNYFFGYYCNYCPTGPVWNPTLPRHVTVSLRMVVNKGLKVETIERILYLGAVVLKHTDPLLDLSALESIASTYRRIPIEGPLVPEPPLINDKGVLKTTVFLNNTKPFTTKVEITAAYSSYVLFLIRSDNIEELEPIISSPSGRRYDSQSTENYSLELEVNTIQVRVVSPELGKWSIKLRMCVEKPKDSPSIVAKLSITGTAPSVQSGPVVQTGATRRKGSRPERFAFETRASRLSDRYSSILEKLKLKTFPTYNLDSFISICCENIQLNQFFKESEINVFIDKDIGANTIFSVESDKSKEIVFTVQSPIGGRFNWTSHYYTMKEELNKQEFSFPKAVSGNWRVKLRSYSKGIIKAKITVLSEENKSGSIVVNAIRMKTSLSNSDGETLISAKLSKKQFLLPITTPITIITGAEVVAHIIRPDGIQDQQNLSLDPNQKFIGFYRSADVVGIYSVYVLASNRGMTTHADQLFQRQQFVGSFTIDSKTIQKKKEDSTPSKKLKITEKDAPKSPTNDIEMGADLFVEDNDTDLSDSDSSGETVVWVSSETESSDDEKDAEMDLGDVTHTEEQETQTLVQRVDDILNNVRIETYKDAMKALLSLEFNTIDKLKRVVDCIFEKCVQNQDSIHIYALLCHFLSNDNHFRIIIDNTSVDKDSDFKRLLIEKCDQEFSAGIHGPNDSQDNSTEANRIPAFKRRMGTVRLIAQLYNQWFFEYGKVLNMIKQLLDHGQDQSLDIMCDLLKRVGSKLDVKDVGIEWRSGLAKTMTEIFERMQVIADHKDLETRVSAPHTRRALWEVIYLRVSKWKSMDRKTKREFLEFKVKEMNYFFDQKKRQRNGKPKSE